MEPRGHVRAQRSVAPTSNSNSASRSNFDAQLAEHANEIRRLGQRAVGDIVEIGWRLIAAKELCGHGNWLSWLEREFGWAERTARNFMSAAELAAKSAIVADLNIDLGALYRLAAPSTPAEVVAKVVARGERRGDYLRDRRGNIGRASDAIRGRGYAHDDRRST